MADRILRPDRFDADPHSASAADQWIHWKKTFQNFIDTVQSLDVDSLITLTNYVSPSVYKHIADCVSYEQALTTLENLYIQPKNSIFARHLLSSAKQEPGQSLSEFLHKLKTLTPDCDFQAVSAEKYRDEFVRDSFIRGLNSHTIRQRLLEYKSLDLASAFDIARQLELAHQQSLSYNQDQQLSCTVPKQQLDPFLPPLPSKDNTTECTAFTRTSVQHTSCFFVACVGILVLSAPHVMFSVNPVVKKDTTKRFVNHPKLFILPVHLCLFCPPSVSRPHPLVYLTLSLQSKSMVFYYKH